MPYLCPDTIPTADFICRRVRIPNDIDIVSVVNGALDELTNARNWQEITGSVTPDEIASAMDTMFREYLTEYACLLGSIQLYTTTALPTGVLACDGATYLKADYPALYAVLPSVFIVDSTHFKTPTLYAGSDMSYAIVCR